MKTNECCKPLSGLFNFLSNHLTCEGFWHGAILFVLVVFTQVGDDLVLLPPIIACGEGVASVPSEITALQHTSACAVMTSCMQCYISLQTHRSYHCTPFAYNTIHLTAPKGLTGCGWGGCAAPRRAAPTWIHLRGEAAPPRTADRDHRWSVRTGSCRRTCWSSGRRAQRRSGGAARTDSRSGWGGFSLPCRRQRRGEWMGSDPGNRKPITAPPFKKEKKKKGAIASSLFVSANCLFTGRYAPVRVGAGWQQLITVFYFILMFSACLHLWT